MEDVASRIASRVQITTDGHRAYVDAIEGVFGMDCDYAMLIKLYGTPSNIDTRYSPGEWIGVEKKIWDWQSRSSPHQHVFRGASEHHHAHVYAALYSPHQCILKEDRQS